MQIPFLRPCLPEVEAYLPALRQMQQSRRYSNFGPLVTEFERRVAAELLGGGFVLSVANATLGLMLAIAALRRPRGRYALMPSFTFAATPLAAQWCGLEPWFLDVRADDWCMDEDVVAEALQRLGDDVAVIVTYAAFGAPISTHRYAHWQAAGIPVVIDAAPGLGSQASGVPFARDFPGAVVYSLHATKAFSIGEGGLICSGDAALIERLRRLSNFGFDENRTATGLGLNAKLPEIEAAVALATLDRFAEKMAQREELYAAYVASFERHGLLGRGWSFQSVRGRVPHQFMPVRCTSRVDRGTLVLALAARGIEARTYFSPACHAQPQFSGCPRGLLSVTDELSAAIMSLPLWEEMTMREVEAVVTALADLTPS